VTDTFYVVDLSDIDVVLGVQWLITLGKITTNYQTLEMGFKDSDGKRVVLRGMSTGAPRSPRQSQPRGWRVSSSTGR